MKSSEWDSNADVKSLCSLILASTLKEQDKYQIGLTKIFFRAGMLAFLEALRTARLNQLVTVVQKNVRRWIEMRHYRNLRRRTIQIQCWWRCILAKKQVEEMRRQRAAIMIQRVARGWLARRKYQDLRSAVIKIQASEFTSPELWLTSVIRGHQARKRAAEERTTSAVLRLQSLFRGL